MKNRNTPTKMTVTCLVTVLGIELFATFAHGQESKPNALAGKAAGAIAQVDAKTVTVGAFSVKVPNSWAEFVPSEAAQLRRQYLEQSKQIYQQFSGVSEDPAKSVNIAAFHILGDEGSFVMVSFTVPPQADLIALLKNQVGEKMDWGVREGYLRKYLGMVTVADEQLSGFYTKAIGKSGNVEVSGGLEHKKLKNTIIQLTLLSPKTWDEAMATNSLAAFMKSVVLIGK